MPPKAGTGQQVVSLEGIFGTMRLSETMSTSEYQARPGFGSSGKTIALFPNMYQARFKKQGLIVYHYDFDINPVVKVANQKKPKSLLWDIWAQLEKEITGDLKPAIDAGAFDSVRNMYSPIAIKMEDGKRDIVVTLKENGVAPDDDRRRFKITIKLANTVDLDTIVDFCKANAQTEQAKEMMLVAVQAMGVLFRQHATHLYKPVGAQGRRFFGLEGAVPIPDGGLVYNGFMQSFRWTQAGTPAVQLDTAYSAFVQPGMLHEVAACLLGMGGGGAGGGRGGRGGFDRGRGRGGPPGGGGAARPLDQLSPQQVRKLNEVLRNAKFQITHRPSSRLYTMRGLTNQAASDLKFLLEDKNGGPGKMISVVDYFKQQFNMTVRHPRLPCATFGSRNYIPMEFVKLAEFNSIPMRSLTADQTASMIKVAAKPPPERRNMITQWRQKLDYSNLPKLKAWNVEVAQEMMKLNGRVLQAPYVQYGANKQEAPRFGSWNLKATKFVKAGRPLKAWSVINFDPQFDNNAVGQFVTQMVKVLQQSNCPVETVQPKIIQAKLDFELENVKPALQQAARDAYDVGKQDPQMILIIMPRKEIASYAKIKRVAAMELKKPVVTQCLQSAKTLGARGDLGQYLGNVSMKIHAKMGGVTHQVPVGQGLDKTTMMIGADVTHPPPKGGLLQPSIAVTVAGLNGDHNLFQSCMRTQEGRVEIIQALVDMITTHIKAWNGGKQKPERIVVFRDGVSEGQYGHCAQQEYSQILEACRALDPKYRPKITFVVCAKRHNMRFFAANPGDADRTGNLPPGTVVDSGVTHPYAFDFYLQAHAGLQGTARPTHYIVVKDENGFSADKMQGLCNALCYSYARATKAVSMVPVAYYADIIATKARDMIYKDDGSCDAQSTLSSGPQKTETFDPELLKKRIEGTQFNNVAWYM